MNSYQKRMLMSIPGMKQIKMNYERKHKKRMKGRGFFDDVGNWIKKAAVDTDAWLKKTKALSTLGNAVGALGTIPGFQEFLPIAGAVKGAAGLTGYGHKRMHMKGMGVPSAFNTIASSSGKIKI